MPNRILKESVCTSESVDRLSVEAERFWYRLIVQCDDYGRMDARPEMLRARCFPLKLQHVQASDITCWLTELASGDKHALIALYAHAGQPYLQVINWDKHQTIRAKRSKYPEMQADEIIYKQMQAYVPVIQSVSVSESNPKGNPNPNTPPPASLPEQPEPEGDCLEADDPVQKPKLVNLDMTAISLLMKQLHKKCGGTSDMNQCRSAVVDALAFRNKDATAVQRLIDAHPQGQNHFKFRELLGKPPTHQGMTAAQEREHYAAQQKRAAEERAAADREAQANRKRIEASWTDDDRIFQRKASALTTPEPYTMWFFSLRVRRDAGKLIIEAPNNFSKGWITGHFSEVLRQSTAAVMGKDAMFEVVVADKAEAISTAAVAAKEE